MCFARLWPLDWKYYFSGFCFQLRSFFKKNTSLKPLKCLADCHVRVWNVFRIICSSLFNQSYLDEIWLAGLDFISQNDNQLRKYLQCSARLILVRTSKAEYVIWPRWLRTPTNFTLAKFYWYPSCLLILFELECHLVSFEKWCNWYMRCVHTATIFVQIWFNAVPSPSQILIP